MAAILAHVRRYSKKAARGQRVSGTLTGPALPAAVDPQHLTRDERAHGAGEQLDDARDFIDGGDAVERARLDHPGLIDRAGAEEAAGAGVAGGDAVHGDVVGAQLVGEAASVVQSRPAFATA